VKQEQNSSFFYFNVFSVPSDSANLLKQIKSDHLKKTVYSASKDVLKLTLPKSVTFIPQPLADKSIGVEIWDSDFEFKILSEHICVCNSFFGKWAFIYGISAPQEIRFQDQVRYVLEKTELLLKDAGFRFQDLIRTWFYIGDILKKENSAVRYDLFNKIRNKFYEKIWNTELYPASTGIGMKEKGIIMEGIALKPYSNTKVIRIENPLQKSAFKYEIPEERRPKFCRAIFVGEKNKGIIFVSGTASIRGEEVCFADDVEKQTHVTIENIEALIKRDNLQRYGIDWNVSSADIDFVKVYIKKEQYYPLVRKVCQQYFGDIPALYLVADICRPELLVEIEAILIKS